MVEVVADIKVELLDDFLRCCCAFGECFDNRCYLPLSPTKSRRCDDHLMYDGPRSRPIRKELVAMTAIGGVRMDDVARGG